MRTKILFGALLLSVALCSQGFSQCCAPEPACCANPLLKGLRLRVEPAARRSRL